MAQAPAFKIEYDAAGDFGKAAFVPDPQVRKGLETTLGGKGVCRVTVPAADVKATLALIRANAYKGSPKLGVSLRQADNKDGTVTILFAGRPAKADK